MPEASGFQQTFTKIKPNMNNENTIGGASAINFPVETNDGYIWKKANIIFYQNNGHLHTSEINLDLLRYAYFVVNKRGEATLFLFDNHQHYLPTHFNGFKEIYITLSEKFGFDDKAFSEHLYSKEMVKKEIWRRKRANNYQVMRDGRFGDYAEGFEIQSLEKDFFSWDTTYDELAEHKYVYIEKSPYGLELLKFKFPVRVGNIVMDNLGAYLENERRGDAPLLHFYADCYDETNSHNSYWELKDILEQDIEAKGHLFGYERDDQHYYSFDIKGMQISIVYTFDSEWQFDGGSTIFSIKNNREYADLLIDQDYENAMEVSDFILLNEQVYIIGNYKKDPQLRRRPAKLNLKADDKPMVWLDNKNGRIGFADKSRCKIEDLNAVESFTIQNVLPAKGGGGAYLIIKLNNGRNYEVISGKCYCFDSLGEKLAQMTNKPVGMAPEYHDC